MSLFAAVLLRSSIYSKLCITLPRRSFLTSQVKYLYSHTALGLDGYFESRKRSKEQFTNFTDTFKTKMVEFTSDNKNMVFTEDLKNMLHLAEPTDLKLVLQMIKKFNSQQSEYRFGSYVFGPVVMRMFHFLDAPKDALECFYDPMNEGFFDQLISYQILLDLLYSHEMYDEMYKVFEKIELKQINMTKFPKYVMVLILAACYKQNTPESMQYALQLWSKITNAGTIPLRRACAYFSVLALKQGLPHVALESICSQKQNYVTIRNIKVLALTGMGRVVDALPVLRTVLDVDRPLNVKNTYFQDTIETVKKAVKESNNKDIQMEFDNIYRALVDRGLIDTKTMDDILNRDIDIMTPQDPSRGTSSFSTKRMPFRHHDKNQGHYRTPLN